MQYAYGGDAGLCPRVHSAFNLKELQQLLDCFSVLVLQALLQQFKPKFLDLVKFVLNFGFV
jgi:hypothetical protein